MHVSGKFNIRVRGTRISLSSRPAIFLHGPDSVLKSIEHLKVRDNDREIESSRYVWLYRYPSSAYITPNKMENNIVARELNNTFVTRPMRRTHVAVCETLSGGGGSHWPNVLRGKKSVFG